ncbi:MAG TPA: cysteine hydrolase family protein [Drouetiella sp.]|jgi:nicotinamidase-related amidase
MSKRAVIFVDIQNDYFPGGKWTLHAMEAAADNAAELLDSARRKGDLVVHVRHEFPTAEAPFFSPGSEGSQINVRVKNRDNEVVILKHHINSYRETNLKEVLDKNGIEEVIICGAMSHMCIDAVARASNDFGYKVSVVQDACATRDLELNGQTIPAQQVHAAFMSALGFGYATLLSTEDYLKEPTKAASPGF